MTARPTEWLAAHWVAGAAFMAGLQLLLVPLIDPALLLVFLHGPAYMLHQVEEHAGDRFRRFVNERVFHSEALSTPAVLWINLPGVWGLNLLALYAATVAPGWGLAAPWLVVVNALSHIAIAIRLRAPNPGVFTSVLVFLPLGLAAIALTPATVLQQATGLGVSLAVHLAIILHTLRAARAHSP